MSTRTVLVVSAASNQAKRVTIGADVTTWGQLKAIADVRSLISGDVEALVRETKTTLSRDESVLPEDDFGLFLVPTKNKAGISQDYSSIGTAVAEAIRKAASIASDDDVNELKEELIEVIAEHFEVDAADLGNPSDDDEIKEALEEAKQYTPRR